MTEPAGRHDDVTARTPAAMLLSGRSTSAKIFIILTLALLPLSVICALASIEVARSNRVNRTLAAHLLAGDSADRLNLFVDRAVARLRSARRDGVAGCARAAADIGGTTRVALFNASGDLICASEPFVATVPLQATPETVIAQLDYKTRSLRLIAAAGSGWALAEIPAAQLAQASHPNAVDGSYDLELEAPGGGALPLARMHSVSLGHDIDTELPIAGGQLRLALRIKSSPLSANEILLLLLPLLMWAAAAWIGWLVVDRLILRPLGILQQAVDRYTTRGGRLELPLLTTPAQEIRSLGEALTSATGTIARHEAELEEGLARQTRLTREVHHRVKNNLQVVASLLNIHSRGATTPEAAAAYGTIQRRVDALALVHRSHYAELEVNRGIALKPLIGELAANLRGSLPRGPLAPTVQLDVQRLQATQDVAVSVAFLLTELLEVAMLRVPGAAIAIGLHAVPDVPGRARLAVRSQALREDAAPIDESYERSQRVLTGLARQLRASPDIDGDTGGFAIEITVTNDSG